MKYRPHNFSGVMGAALLTALCFASQPAAAQDRAPAAKPPAAGKTPPRTADGHPDLNGFWRTAQVKDTQQFQRAADGSVLFDFSTEFNEEVICQDDSCQAPNQPPYKPEYMAKVKEIAATENGGSTPLDPQMDCRPLGVPRAGIGAMQIVQSPKATAILYEAAPSSTFRIIYTDGRPHPKDLDTTYMGDSIGHWEGDTLVVDVVGLNGETWLGGDVRGFVKYTSIHSEKEHVVERWTRKGDTLTYEATVEDPVMFSRPWVLAPRHVQLAAPGDTLLESVCTPNDKSHIVKPNKEEKACNYRCSDETK
jgi:hypothetical protein